MEQLISIPHDEVEKIANNNRVNVSTIIELLDVLNWYLSEVYDSSKEFRSRFPKNNEHPWSKDPLGWAELSLFYHENKEELTLSEPKLFKKAVFTYNIPSKAKQLQLSEFVSNQMIKTYLEEMELKKLLYDQIRAEGIKKFWTRPGKRQSEYYKKRNDLLLLAASFLMRNEIVEYAPILENIFEKIGYKGLTRYTIRVTVSRSH